MGKVNKDGIELDMCSQGCIFLDPGELDALLRAAVMSFQGHQMPTGHQFLPPVPQGQHIRNPHAYVTNGFGPAHTSRRRRRGHGSGGIFGSSGSFGSGSFGS